ncbi:hypothetical protein [Mycobacterium sp. NAZ190054]|uniref:hypothetical protein n=1 Tax=Mycobacterium sp. NAZ190054 TaxID=1747766 RepID=UPI0007918A78|nr:hypothetical protein [Mycobacterium sp. NAZ190054]KWX67537.1 hypothetical protein ASJ79_21475 [Mycobacterium sp. NAZ190054]
MPYFGSFVTAGVALVGAGAIVVAPVTPPTAQMRTVGMPVNLSAATTAEVCGDAAVALCGPSGSAQPATAGTAVAAAPSIFNIPANLFIALANIPYNFFNALGQGDVNLGDLTDSQFSFVNSRNGIDLNQTGVVGLTADLEYGGSWWVYHPFNVLGTDPADIARYQALVNVLLPFPALSVGLGNILAAVAASQLPMNVGCTGTNVGACDRPDQILSTMFDLRHIVALFSPGGYTFPEVRNPITCSPDGLCDIKDPDGVTEPWSQQNSALNIFTPFQNFFDALTETPDFSQIRFPTLDMIVNTITNLIRGLNTAFNPFVLGTQCGLCSLFVPVPPGVTRPGSTNPDTRIQGVPGTENATTDDVTTESTDENEPGQTEAATSPRQRQLSRQESADEPKAAVDSEESSTDDYDETSPPTDDVRRGHVDGSGDAPPRTFADDEEGSAKVRDGGNTEGRDGGDTKGRDGGDTKGRDGGDTAGKDREAA